MKIALKKKGYMLKPAFNSDIESFNKLRENTVYLANLKLPRNILTFKKYWALCRMIADRSDKMHFREDADKFLKFKAGHVDYIYTGEKELLLTVKSIAFENMTGEEWDVFYNSVLPHICEELECTEHDIEENIIFAPL
jgi:hypothetical protein